MKSKLVKYPFDEKKYRWDTHKMGKTFEYSWERTTPNNYDTLTPYIEAYTTSTATSGHTYAYAGLDGSSSTAAASYFDYHGIGLTQSVSLLPSGYCNAVGYVDTDSW